MNVMSFPAYMNPMLGMQIINNKVKASNEIALYSTKVSYMYTQMYVNVLGFCNRAGALDLHAAFSC